MFLLLLSVISIIVALIRKGSFSNILDCGIRAWYLFVVALLAFLAVKVGDSMQIVFIQSYAKFFLLGAYALLLVGAIFNLSNLWMIPLLAGSLCNFVVIFMNSGKMPLTTSALEIAGITATAVESSSVLSVASSSTSLLFLGGIIPIPLPGILAEVISPGTILIGVGLFFIIQNILLGIVYEYEYEDDEDYDDEYDDEYDDTHIVEDVKINPVNAHAHDVATDFISDDEIGKDYTSDDILADELRSANFGITEDVDEFSFEPDSKENISDETDSELTLLDDEFELSDDVTVESVSDDLIDHLSFEIEGNTMIEEQPSDDFMFEDVFEEFGANTVVVADGENIDSDISIDFDIPAESQDDSSVEFDSEPDTFAVDTEIDETATENAESDFDFSFDAEEIDSTEKIDITDVEEHSDDISEDIGDFDLLSDFSDLFDEESFNFEDIFAETTGMDLSDAIVEEKIDEEEVAEAFEPDIVIADVTVEENTGFADDELQVADIPIEDFDLDMPNINDDLDHDSFSFDNIPETVNEDFAELIADEEVIFEDSNLTIDDENIVSENDLAEVEMPDEIELADDVELSDVDFIGIFDDMEVTKEETINDIADESIEENASEESISEAEEIQVKTVEDISDTDYTDNELLDVEFEEFTTEEEPDIVEDEPADEPEPIDIDSPFIIVNGRIVENPNYKFRKGVDYYEADRSAAIRVAEPVNKAEFDVVEESIDSQDNNAASISELSPNGFEKVEMKIGDVQIKFWKRDNE